MARRKAGGGVHLRAGRRPLTRPGAFIVALSLYVAAAPLVILPDGQDAANLPQSAFVVVVGWLLCAWRLSTERRPGAPTTVDRLLAAFLAWAALSLLWADNRYEGLVVLVHWSSSVAICFLLRDALESRANARTVLTGLWSAGVAVAVLAIGQRLFGWDFLPQAMPPAATFVNKNVAAQFVAIVAPLAATVVAPAPLAITGTIVCAAYLVLPATRSAWLASAVAVSVLALLAGPRRVRLLAGAVGLILFLMIGYETMVPVPRAPGQPILSGGLASVRGRLAVWRNTLVMVADHPIRGVGLGNHKIAYPPYARRATVDPLFSERRQLDHVHNEPLQIAAELGLVGLLLALAAAAAVAAQLRSLWPLAADPEDRRLAAAVAASLAALAVESLVSFPFQRALPPFVAALHIGILASLARRLGGADPRPARARLALATAAAVIAVTLGWAYGRALAGDRQVRRAMEASKRNDWPRMLDAAEGAWRHNPWRKEAPFLAGTAHLAGGRPAQALPFLEAAVRLFPHDLPALGNLAAAYAASGDAPRALYRIEEVVTLRPEDGAAQYQRGALLEKEGRVAEAVGAYRAAAEAEPREHRYAHRLGMTALRLGELDVAAEAFEAALAANPRSATSHRALGLLLAEHLGRTDEGLAHLRRSTEEDPSSPETERVRRVIERLAGR